MVRLYVGGLPEGTSVEELTKRFTPFGSVDACEIAPPKCYRLLSPSAPVEIYPRSFGYVSLEPKDEQSLRRALQVYNGCKWRGSVLRCYVAKESGPQRAQAEAELDKQPAAPEAAEAAPAAGAGVADGTVLRIRKPFSKELVSVTLGGRDQRVQHLHEPAAPAEGAAALQPAAPPQPVQRLPLPALWEPLEAPAGDRYTYERLLRREAQARRDDDGALSDDGDGLSQWVAAQAERAEHEQERGAAPSRGKPAAAARKTAAQARQAAQAAAKPRWSLPADLEQGGPEPEPAPAPKRVRTVDFFTMEDEMLLAARKPAVDLSRFGGGSSDDEDGPRIPQTDGAADLDSSDKGGGSSDSGSSSSDQSEDEDEHETAAGSGGSSGSESSDSEPSEASKDVAAAAGGSGEEDEGGAAAGEAREGGDVPPAAAAAGFGGEEEEEDVAWLRDAFPAGATFFRSEPLVQAEAAWRAGREAAARDYRDKRRQAVRHAARPSGGKRGRR